MATSKGIIQLEGTLDKISFYTRLGKPVVRRSGGPSADKIRSENKFLRVRENIDEFYNGSIVVAQILRRSLVGFKHLWGPTVSGRLNGLLRKEIASGEGERGKRPVQLRKYNKALENFQFGNATMTSVFAAPYSFALNNFRNRAEFNLPSFVVKDFINPPSGATHFRILLGIAVISEYVFVQSGERYKAIDEQANGKNKIESSGYISVNGSAQELSLTVNLDEIIPAETSATIVCIGIEFYQQVGGEMYFLRGGGASQIINNN